MKAAIITSFDRPPHYSDFADPAPAGPGTMLVDVLAVGLHHLTRGMATGAHYASAGRPPLVPGVDGVGRGTDGRLRYFVLGRGQLGSLAERTVIEVDHSIELPEGCDPVAVAAAMNPGMAAWGALRCRVPFRAGQNVLILGATGSSGRMAVQIARHLGAWQVIAAGRNEQRLAELPALGATESVALGDPRLGVLACEADVVLDFVWGETSVRVMEGVLKQRGDRGAPLTWVHVGGIAGDVAPIPGGFLRAAKLQLVGSGLGSISGPELLRELPALVMEIVRGTFRIDAKVVPLRDVEHAWSHTADGGERIVIVP